MKTLTFLFVVAMPAIVIADGIYPEQIRKRFSYDRDETSGCVHVYLKSGRVVGLEPSGVPIVEKVGVPLPPRSKVTRVYYGYSPKDRMPNPVMWELDSAEITLFDRIIGDMSFSYRARGQLYQVTNTGDLKGEDVGVSRMIGHFCTIGFYVFSEGGKQLYIDGHADAEDFMIDEPQFCTFRNPTLNAVLAAKLKYLKEAEANQTPVPTATSVTPAADAPVAPAAAAAQL